MHDVLEAIPYFGATVTEQCQLPSSPQDMRELCPWFQGSVPRKTLAHQFPTRFFHRAGFEAMGSYYDHLTHTQQPLCSSRCGQIT